MSAATHYRVTPANTAAPSVVLAAVDGFDLEKRIARHLTRHKLLRPGIKYESVDLGAEHAAFFQPHAPTVHVKIEEVH